jgi:neutral amino acid transport system permease protein
MALADFVVSLGTVIAIYSLFGLGLNVKFGFTGLIDFGHVLYFMIGAYVTVVLTLGSGTSETYGGIVGPGLPELVGAVIPGGEPIGWFLGILGGMAAAALVSLLVAIPTLRLREDYLAIAALGVATILHAVISDEIWLFNGPYGIRDVHQPLSGVFPLGLGSFWANLIVLGAASLVVLTYLAYLSFRIIRNISVQSGILTTATAALLVTGMAGLSLESIPVLLGGVLLLGSVALGAVTIRRAEFVEPVVALAATAVFVAWYFVQPFVASGGTELLTNALFLFDPSAGPNGGLDYSRFKLLLSVGFLVVAYYWIERTVRSPYGRVLRSIREDEEVPTALGKPVFRYKVQAMMFGSALAGAAGALFAVNIGFIAPEQFLPSVTFFAFTAVIIGGTANNRGVILGTVVFWVINSGTSFLNDYFSSEYAVQISAARMIVIGLLLMIILYYRPEGILGEQNYDIQLPRASGGGTDE